MAIGRRELLIGTAVTTIGLAVGEKISIDIGRSQENPHQKKWRDLITGMENAKDSAGLESSLKEFISDLYNPEAELPPTFTSLEIGLKNLRLTKLKVSPELRIFDDQYLDYEHKKTLEEALLIFDSAKGKNIKIRINYKAVVPSPYILTIPRKSRQFLEQIPLAQSIQIIRSKDISFDFVPNNNHPFSEKPNIKSQEQTAVYLSSPWVYVTTVKKVNDGQIEELYGFVVNIQNPSQMDKNRVGADIAGPVYDRITALTQ